MIRKIVEENLEKYKDDIDSINEKKTIDCITIFSTSNEDYEVLNKELSNNRLIDEMSSGNLYYLDNPIDTIYGDLSFIKVRKHDDNYNDYRISVDFVIDDYNKYKNSLKSPIIKTYDTFELIQFKNNNSIINIISLSAKDDYKIDDINKLIDIHLNGDIDLKRIIKKDYDILYSDIVPDIDYNYAFIKNNKNIDVSLDEIKEDFKKLNRKAAIYVLNNSIESDRLELNHIDTWMLLDEIKEYKTSLNIDYDIVSKEELKEFVDTFMINFSSDDPNEPYQGLDEGYRKTFTDNFESHDGFNSIYYSGKINNKMICTCMGIYKGNTIILYAGSVDKELRGKGIFKEFLNYIVNDLKNKSINNICLQTEKGYYPEKLYSKLGFKEILLGYFYNIKE